jgi:hypothetical protein
MKNKTISTFTLLIALIIPSLCCAQDGSTGTGAFSGLTTLLFIVLAIFIGLLFYPLFINYQASKNKANYSSIVLGLGLSCLLLCISLALVFIGGVPAIISLLVSLYSIRQLQDKKDAFTPKRDSTLLDDI